MAISISTVYFGAMTYIGNGPNFLVKSIADHSKLKSPSFFGYLFKYSLADFTADIRTHRLDFFQRLIHSRPQIWPLFP